MYEGLGITIPTINLPPAPVAELTFWQKLSNTVNTITDKVKAAQPAVSKAQELLAQLKAKESGSASGGGSYVPPGGPQPEPGMSTTTKVVIGVAVIAAIAGITYVATRKKKKGMGEVIDTTHEVVSSDLAGTKKKRTKKRKK